MKFPLVKLIIPAACDRRARGARNGRHFRGTILLAVESGEFPEVWRAVRERRQCPGAGTYRPDIAIDRYFHEIRLVGLDRGVEYVFEIAGTIASLRRDAERARKHRKIRIV